MPICWLQFVNNLADHFLPTSSQNNRCVCEDGSYGNRCEFVAPCDRIEYDPTFEPFQGNRKWAEGYDLLKNGDGRHAEVYGRPVYLSQDRNPDVIFYNGYRWAIASLSDINKNDGGSTSLVDFFENEFHAFWSQYTVGFLSEPVSIDAPDDSNTPAQVSWYQAQVKTTSSFQGSDLNKPVESKFLCAKCNNDTNPCLFGGVCIDHTCKCTQGSFGKLCHIPPTGNGYCDSYFNTLEFDFDGGDCCKETCVSTLEHTCGEGIIGQSFGVDAFGYVGFNECKEEGALQGVTTLSRIKKRGNLICGASRSQIKQLSQFYENQCRAIAAAIFGNPPSFEMSYFETDRFNELKSGVFDVLFGSDFTASRDISEVNYCCAVDAAF